MSGASTRGKIKLSESSKPLRRPKTVSSLSTSGLSTFNQIPDEWRNLRIKILSLTRENYVKNGKSLAKELQLIIRTRANEVEKAVHLIYERSVKDLFGYPIGALLFEDLGNPVNGGYVGEDVLDSLQNILQESLTSLQNKLGKMAQLEGVDVGVVFLIYLLFRLETLRGGENNVFKDLLLKLFKAFYVYILGASQWPLSYWNDSVVSAYCVLISLIFQKKQSDSIELRKATRMLDILRPLLFKQILTTVSKLQILRTIEIFASSGKDDLRRDDVLNSIYKDACNKSDCLLSGITNVLLHKKGRSSVDSLGSDGESKNINEEKSSVSKRDSLNLSVSSHGDSDVFNELNTSDPSKNGFVAPNENVGNIEDPGRKSVSFEEKPINSEKQSLSPFGINTNTSRSSNDKNITVNTKTNLLVKNESNMGEGEKKSIGIQPSIDHIVTATEEKKDRKSSSSSDDFGRGFLRFDLLTMATKLALCSCQYYWHYPIQDSAGNSKVHEIITVPEDCIGRVIGYEGAIVRKLEFQSGTSIRISKEAIEPAAERPDTSCLTAHRLVAGALGLPSRLDQEKLQAENDKLALAKGMGVKTTVRGAEPPKREVEIVGDSEAVRHAKHLIDEIVNCTTFMVLPILGFTVDTVLELAGSKLKTIETLLNVKLRLEENEDESVVLHVSGDEKACQDAKKLVFEELGSLRSEQGHLVGLSPALAEFLQTEDALQSFVYKLYDVTGARVQWLQGAEGHYLFVGGYPSRVGKALSVASKVNTELLCRGTKSNQSDAEGEIRSLNDLLHLVDVVCEERQRLPLSRQLSRQSSGGLSRQLSRQSSGPSTKAYSREFLLSCSTSPTSWKFPETLQRILDGDDDDSKSIILKQGIGEKTIVYLTKPREVRLMSV